MEMGSVLVNHNGDFIYDTSEEQFLSPVSSNIYNVFGDPELFPRIGDQYQVEIPPMITESEFLFYKKNPFEVEFAPGVSSDFLVGLPIPIMCINMEDEYSKHGLEFLGGSNGTTNRNGLLKSETNKEARITSKFKAELVDIAWENGFCSGESANLGLEHEMKRKMHQKCRGVGYRLVPGSFGGTWSDIEVASFLLGLYIFGKNFVQVKKFIEIKSMGDIQSFYYGKFYRSDEYRRWSDCRKMRSRRCVYGQRIFTGLRQQELLSRLFLHVSEECQTTLMEVSKTFGEGKMSLEEYVYTLKAVVGMNSFIEAVGIGKGKRDLTGIAMEPSKSNNISSTRPEIPIGKACSSLTPEEIIKFLTGDFRLSKARSNDLFWEAVWPRLLARGWHSEQPKDQSYAAGLKHSLVFLMPGVKKFSRRRLRRGNQYFDSVTDVLSKVAADPSLIDLESEVVDSNENKEEFGWTNETNLEQDDLSDRRRHCYLQPRTPNRGTDLMKFTIVDTSLAYGKTFKVRELRTLPDEVSKKAVFRSHSEESDENSSEVSSEDSDSADAMLIDREDTNNAKSAKTLSAIDLFSENKDTNNAKSAKTQSAIDLFSKNKDLEIGVSNQGVNGLDSGNVKPSLVSQSDSGNASFKNSKEVNRFCDDKQPRKSLKCGLKQDDLNYIGPVMKRRRRLSACTQAESSHHLLSFSVRPSLEQEKHICISETTDSSENNLSGMGSSQKRVSSTNSSKGSLVESTEGISCDTNIGTVGPNDEPQPRTLIDLNFPQVSTDFETGEASMMGLRGRQDFETGEASMMGLRDTQDFETSEASMMGLRERQDDTISKPENSTAPKLNADVTSPEQQPNVNSRRQSTRNRPPTARALEALVNGFLTTNRRQKNKEACPRKKSTARPPRRARDGMEVTEDFSSATVASQMVEVGNGESNDKSNMFQTFQVRSEGKVAQVIGPQISITGSFQL